MSENQKDVGGPPCEMCGRLMTFVRATPKLGALPALQTFVCTDCGDVRAIEIEERPATTYGAFHQLRGGPFESPTLDH